MNRSSWYRAAISALGFKNLAALQLSKYAARIGMELRVGSRDLVHPVLVRPQTSDKWVFQQIFIDREYRCLDDIENLDLVLDCGANVGYASAYFLSRHPNAFVVAVEPDIDNFRQIQKNLAPYDPTRYSLFHGAIWDEPTTLNFAAETMEPGAEWGRRSRAGYRRRCPGSRCRNAHSGQRFRARLAAQDGRRRSRGTDIQPQPCRLAAAGRQYRDRAARPRKGEGIFRGHRALSDSRSRRATN